MKTIKIMAADFDDALRVMHLIIPTTGIDNVSISPSATSDRWIVEIKDSGISSLELVKRGAAV